MITYKKEPYERIYEDLAMKIKTYATAMAISLIVCGISQADTINGVSIDFVNITGAGNSADSTGYGAVGYNYRIGTFEITIDQFNASPAGSGNEGTSGAKPASFISWHEAARYCNWLTSSNANLGAYSIDGGGNVIGIDRTSAVTTYGVVYVMPTEDEWYKAAYYKNGSYFLYANGLSNAPSAGSEANYSGSSSWVVGTGSNEVNGTYDMMGNVWEWTESLSNTNQSIGSAIAFRGGGYDSGNNTLQSVNRFSDSPTLQDPRVGMRIVAIPEPGTISLMSLSTVSLFLARTLRRRKRVGMTLMPVRREPLCDVFGSEEDWRLSRLPQESQRDSLAEIGLGMKSVAAKLWNAFEGCYRSLDKAFWNRMVARYESRVKRRKKFRAAFKQRLLDGFDTFLSLIMK